VVLTILKKDMTLRMAFVYVESAILNIILTLTEVLELKQIDITGITS